MEFIYMRINNRDSHGTMMRGSEKGLVVINKKMSSITTNEVIRSIDSTTVGESKEEVVLLWQKQIHENYVSNHMKGGDAR
jgi:hypothetical protein